MLILCVCRPLTHLLSHLVLHPLVGVTVEEGRDYLIVHGLKPGQKPNAAVGN